MSLRYHQGRPVPWITKWSAEVAYPRLAHVRRSDGSLALRYRDQNPYDARYGVLWMRDGIGPGRGEPLWSQVHTGRQRTAMTRLRCQVCGASLAAFAGSIPWLLPTAEWEPAVTGRQSVTGTAPTCRSCWAIARRYCPALRRVGAVGCVVQTATVWGVIGDVIWPTRWSRQQLLSLPDAAGLPVLAMQMLVELSGITAAEI